MLVIDFKKMLDEYYDKLCLFTHSTLIVNKRNNDVKLLQREMKKIDELFKESSITVMEVLESLL